MSRSRCAKRLSIASDESGVDLNPMLDVVFILLIFFIVTASFVNESVLPEYSEQEHASAARSSAVSVVLLDAHGRIVVDGRVIVPTAIRPLMAEKRARFGEVLQVNILSSGNAHVEAYTTVVDALQKAAIDNISLKLMPEKETHNAP